MEHVLAYSAGLASVIFLWVISFVITGRRASPFALAIGVDKNYSASLLQFLVFTYVTIFAYVAVYVARLSSKDGLTPLPNIPLNLLILMGISVASATASKGIVVSYVDQGKLPPASAVGGDTGGKSLDKSNVVSDKLGNVALTKVQMLIWTFIAAGIYLITVVNFINEGSYIGNALPDVDGALLVLMGASQGGYIGGKLSSTSPSSSTLPSSSTGIPTV